MQMNEELRRIRRIAHWILRQLLNDSIEKSGKTYSTGSAPNPIINTDVHESGTFEYSTVILAYLKELTNEFSMAELCEASSLLLLNGDIVITDQSVERGVEYSFIKATHAGKVSYQENKYKIHGRKEINVQTWASWILGLISGKLIPVTTVPEISKK
jgi:hypothetical protein